MVFAVLLPHAKLLSSCMRDSTLKGKFRLLVGSNQTAFPELLLKDHIIQNILDGEFPILNSGMQATFWASLADQPAALANSLQV